MRSTLRWLVLALLAVSFVPVGGASASCAAPSISRAQDTGETFPGDSFRVQGAAFVDGCNDGTGTTVGVLGCSDQEEPEPEVPNEDVRLLLRQGDRTWVLGQEDAGTAADDRLGRITWEVTLPADVRPGRSAVLIADVGPAGDLRSAPRTTFVVDDNRAM